MDRLRSLECFVASAEEGSFSGAARRLGVSIPAVAKMVNALERDLAITLFVRSPQGSSLTGAGETYLLGCKTPMDALRDLDEQIRGARTRPRGNVVVGIQHVAAQELVAPALDRFHARFPDITLDFRDATQMKDADTPGIDLFLSFAWPKTEDLVHRALARSHFRVCAAPSYWASRGTPQHPHDLRDHDCILIRAQTGTIMDLWAFTRGGEREDVVVNGWLVCSNTHRDVAVRMALGGQGVIRLLDWTERAEIDSGALVPVLSDWHCPDAPPIVLSYRPSARKIARVRLFIEFVQELFRVLEAGERATIGSAPRWAGSQAPRASLLPGRK